MRWTLAALIVLVAPLAAADDWGTVRRPSRGPAEPIGSYTNGCIAGAQPVPIDGDGYAVVRLHRRRYFGHPDMVAYLQDLGRRVAAARIGLLLVGDVSQPRGGPMPTGHASHQVGLDVDLWYRLDATVASREAREHPALPSVVDARTNRVDPSRWTRAHTELVRLAATGPNVARVFVHPAVKQALCEQTRGDRAWLRRVRPWYGHDDHLHVRLDCPRDARECVAQPSPPEGDGCGAELTRWLDPRTRPRPTPHDGPPPPMPAACEPLLRDGAGAP